MNQKEPKKLDNKKPLLIILGSAFVLILLIIVPFVLTGERNENKGKNAFPSYESIKISEDTFTDAEKYNDLKEKLSNDYLFGKILFVDDYDSSKVSQNDIANLATKYVTAYELLNTKYLAITNKKKQYFCMTEKNLVTSFKELYNMDITPYLSDLSYYHKYFFKKKNYCVYYKPAISDGAYSKHYYINKLEYNDSIITADIYTYLFSPVTEGRTENQNALKAAFENKNFARVKELIKNEVDGEYSRKTVRFKINNDGKFFKYQIISIKTIDN